MHKLKKSNKCLSERVEFEGKKKPEENKAEAPQQK